MNYNLFTPGAPLQAGLFVVSEQVGSPLLLLFGNRYSVPCLEWDGGARQLPGYYEVAEQTMVLQRGYWPSYNVPFYETVSHAASSSSSPPPPN